MPDMLLLTYSDFLPLREDPKAIHGALQAVEDALPERERNGGRHGNLLAAEQAGGRIASRKNSRPP